MAQFYGTKIEPDEKCASFGTRLEQKLNQVSLQYPSKISESMYWNCVREGFLHGLSKDMRTNLRTQFDSGANYYRLLELARVVESESLHEDSKVESKTTSTKGKGKVSVATVDSTSQQIQQLQGAVKGLTKMLQGNQQLNQTTPQYVSQPAQSAFTELVQNDKNTLPQASPSQNSASFVNTQGGRGGRGGYRGRGRGGSILCYWCRDFLHKEQASHKVVQCPYQKQAKDSWWKNQLGNVQGGGNSSTIGEKGKLTRGTTHMSKGEVPVVSPNDSKPLKEIKQMLELEKNSSKSTSVDDTLHSFTPTSNARNGFRRKKGDSPFTYNLNLKV